MNGREEYNYRLKIKNDKYIHDHPELRGFKNYLSDYSQTTVYNYLLIITRFNEYVKKPEQRLTIDDFSGYLNIMKFKENGELRNNSNMITIYHALKNYASYLEAKGVLKNNPMEKVRRPKFSESQITIQKRENAFLTSQEITELLNNIKQGVGSSKAKSFQEHLKERDIAIVLVFLSTGIRCSALCNLDVDSYDATNHRLIVTDKGDKTQFFSLNSITCDAINTWLHIRSRMIADTDNCNALFISQKRKRMDQSTISYNLKKYTITIQGKHITPHKLRATYGTQLYEATKDIYFVQKAMGHNSPTTTERYVRGQDEVTKEASDIMGRLF